MKKNIYEKPGMMVVNLLHQQIICASVDANGMNKSLQEEEVNHAWTKENNGSGSNAWDQEW